MNYLKLTGLILSFFVFLSLPLAHQAAAAPTTEEQIFAFCQIKTNQKSPICRPPTTENPILHIVNVAAGIVAIATGAIAVLIIIIGGIGLITSGGNPEAVKKNRQRIIDAAIGLVIVVLAWSIINFTIDKLIQ